MNDTPTRLFVMACVLVGVWIVTYWLYEPGEPAVTFAQGSPAVESAGHDAAPPAAPDAPPRDPLVEDEAQLHGDSPPPEFRAVAPEFKRYVVREGDTSFERIAERVYGDGRYGPAIARANPFVNPTRLIPGRTNLRIPVDPNDVAGTVVAVGGEGSGPAEPAPEAARPAPSAAGAVEHVITRDDTLWDLAKAYYGKGSLWRKIYNANRDVIADPDRPPVGKKITIPPLGS